VLYPPTACPLSPPAASALQRAAAAAAGYVESKSQHAEAGRGPEGAHADRQATGF